MSESFPLRRGARLAIDLGGVRVGVARSDCDGIMAVPVATLQRSHRDIYEVMDLAREFDVIEIVVGLPLNMDGSEGKSAREARRWSRRLARKIHPLPVRLVDERLSSVSAHRQLHDAGRAEITHRSVVDQAAAVVILESALNFERNTGRPAGELVERNVDV